MSILGKYNPEMFMHRFWLDTYYNRETGTFHFKKSNDEVDKFSFMFPMRPVNKLPLHYDTLKDLDEAVAVD